MLRGAGVLLHISSLPGPHGVGDVGPAAYAFVDFLWRAGQTYWQVLPLSPTLPEYDNSPYSALSSFAGNPLFIGLEPLAEEGLAEAPGALPNPGAADYRGAWELKRRALERAFERFKPSAEFEKFKAENAEWLEDYALYIALRERFGGPWTQWPRELRDRERGALRRWRGRLRRRAEFEEFLQFLFLRQWLELKRYANSKGVFVIGDLPIYPSLDSADVWAHKEYFKLGADGRPLYVAGVPPTTSPPRASSGATPSTTGRGWRRSAIGGGSRG